MKPKLIIITAWLIATSICFASASTKKDDAYDKKEVIESHTAKIVDSKEKDGTVSIRCRILKLDTLVMLQTKILRNDSAVFVAWPGIRLKLQNGESMTLKPDRYTECCSDWATGRWDNASFPLTSSDADKLKDNNIVSIHVSTGRGRDIDREIPTKKQDAILKLLRDLE